MPKITENLTVDLETEFKIHPNQFCSFTHQKFVCMLTPTHSPLIDAHLHKEKEKAWKGLVLLTQFSWKKKVF